MLHPPGTQQRTFLFMKGMHGVTSVQTAGLSQSSIRGENGRPHILLPKTQGVQNAGAMAPPVQTPVGAKRSAPID
jgi:hypothetical protein